MKPAVGYVRVSTAGQSADGVSLHLKAKGRRVSGKIPYGYLLASDGKNLIPAPDEQRVLELMRGRRAAGGSYRGIALELAGLGLKTKEGRSSWAPKVVRRILLAG